MSEEIRIKKIPDLTILRKLADRYPKAKIDPENIEVLLLLNRVAGDVTGLYRSEFDGNGLSSARFTLLLRLRREPEKPLNPSELAEFLGVTRATISGLLDGLEKSGQIKRVNCQDDRRSCFIQLTNKGLKLIDKVAPEYFAQLSELLTGVKKSELKSFKKILLLLGQHLENKK